MEGGTRSQGVSNIRQQLTWLFNLKVRLMELKLLALIFLSRNHFLVGLLSPLHHLEASIQTLAELFIAAYL